MKKLVTRWIAFLLVCCMVFGLLACGNTQKEDSGEETQAVQKEDNAQVGGSVQLGTGYGELPTEPTGEYKEGVVLVRFRDGMDAAALGALQYTSVEALYEGSAWYAVALKEVTAKEAVKYLVELGRLAGVDYDYVMGLTADVSTVDVSGNPDYEKQTHLNTHSIPEAWDYLAENEYNPGGSSDVIVAVIDTGVDYNHLDLRNNIWINSAEIPDNGIDDDGNGYVDDIRGWDCVGDDNDPMDDNGHGTHVAGIVAAENNDIGGVGIAFNCKIMVLKAGNSSGYFNSSDIAEAVQYAYMNGASVINMSFGGASIAIAVEEALKDAYNQCVLVAAAGNSGFCNQPGCPNHSFQPPTPFYPASLQYVIGVMSCDPTGSYLSIFSNFDHYPFNNYEYDVMACGEQVYSTWPNNKYATLNGTSMAAPSVAAIAAVLRSVFTDRETYSTKYITAQIVSTVSRTDTFGVADLYTALTEPPVPYIYNIYNYYIFDNVEFSDKNNGNGVIDAGETIHLAFELQNRGGMASNVVATMDTIRNDDPDLTDPYFTIVNDTIQFSDIGTYSVRDCGKIYDEDGNWVGTEKYFEIIVSEDCPNSYLASFNVHITYENGLDETDETVYTGLGSLLCNVNRGYHLPATISEDTVFEADRLYIVSSDVVIPEGVTVTFKEGCQIQFYDNREYYNSPAITVYGTLNFDGTEEKMIKIAPDAHHEEFICMINNRGTLNMSYAQTVNLNIAEDYYRIGPSNTYIDNSYLRDEPGEYGYTYRYANSALCESGMLLYVVSIEKSYLDLRELNVSFYADEVNGCFVAINAFSWHSLRIYKAAVNNIFYSHIVIHQTIPGYPDSMYEFGNSDSTCTVENNRFYSADDNQPSTLARIQPMIQAYEVVYKNNTFSKGYQKYATQVINNYYDATGNPILDVYGSLADASVLWPHVVDVELFDKDGNLITTIGKEEITVRVTFNRPMDTTQDTMVSFGTVVPYDDYRVSGQWISDTVWEGTYTLKAQIENGRNFLKVQNACAAEDPTKTVFGEYQLHTFTIDTTAALSMNLQAVATENGINLTWAQDDYDTLMGYNIYRAEERDGNYVKLNPAILLSTDESFLDENAEPGKTYWYTFTVVLSDFTESAPAGKVSCTAMDTVAPNIYHTPVNQGYENNNLVISCTASDNIAISAVTLYYRTVGAADWKSLTMSKQNDKYSATVFGSELTQAGLEYYIVAVDGGGNTVCKGSAETPYTVVIKDATAASRLGDVDGDGAISTKDALMLMQCLNGDLLLADDAFKRADLNGDGVLSAVEALRILQYINGKVTTLEM